MIVPPYHDAFGIYIAVIVAGHKLSYGHFCNCNPREKTLGKTRFKPVWSAQSIGKPYNLIHMVASRPMAYSNSFSTIFRGDFIYIIAENIIGLIPGNPLPFTFPSLTHS